MSHNLYNASDVRPVHALRYDWTAWFDLDARRVAAASGEDGGVCRVRVASCNLGPTGASPAEAVSPGETRAARHGACPRGGEIEQAIAACRPLWLADGLESGHWQLRPDGALQVLFTVAPQVSPAFCAARAKGRLDHALRRLCLGASGEDHAATGTSPAVGRTEDADPRHHRPYAGGTLIETAGATPFRFRRTVSLRTLGENTRETVNGYIARQAAKSDYVDPRFKTFLDLFNTVQPTIDLAHAQATGHGRYWCNLHLVIVVADRRFPVTRETTFRAVRDAAFATAAAHGHELARIAVMPDHLHLALRFAHASSPLDAGLGFLNGLATAAGQNRRCWSEEFYVGTFSEYDVQAIRPPERESSG